MEYRTIANLGSIDIKSTWFSCFERAELKRDEFRAKFPDAMIQIIDGTGFLHEITGRD